MRSIGVDIGSTTTKAVALDGAEIRAALVIPSGDRPDQAAEAAFAEALSRAGWRAEEAEVVATTGYGRRMAGFGDVVMTEIKACAAGVRFLPGAGAVRTVIDVGGQDTKVIALADGGEIEDFGMNDKCAAGTGRFLEMLAEKLRLSYEDFVAAALGSETLLQMNATCAVFAETEVVGLLARGESKADIASAAHHAIASRVGSMVRRVSSRGAYAFVGGGARNAALVRAVEESLGQPLLVPESPQTVVALGAAAGAQEKIRKRLAQ